MSEINTLNRFTLKIAGESGQGINVVGELAAKSLKRSGYRVLEYREYPSLIKGGFACSQIDISDVAVSSPSEKCDLLVSLSRSGVHAYLGTLKQGGHVVHCIPKLIFTEAEHKLIQDLGIQFHFVDGLKLALDIAQNAIVLNIVMLGVTWRALGLELNNLLDLVAEEFADKPQLVETDKAALVAGYEVETISYHITNQFKQDPQWKDSLFIMGNDALALGAIAAGVRMYCGYPMTPSTSILEVMSDNYQKTGIVIKQAEDEITAAQMTLGAMHAGTRALTGTSGGGFDLMTETLSLAGMIETPFVCILAQRPGPATGLPTWTADGDLNLAVYAGHGEFPRCVVSVSDPESSYSLIQQAFNIAEKYQMPVLVLTDKYIGETSFNIPQLPTPLEIHRYLTVGNSVNNLTPEDRYSLDVSGVSKRWIPGSSEAVYLANSDEHRLDGSLTEDGEMSKLMMEKRMQKLNTLKQELPEPQYFGDSNAEIVLVGWASSKSAVLDAIPVLNKLGINIGYLHYEYIYPVITSPLEKLIGQGKKLYLIENNFQGQLGSLLKQHTNVTFADQFLKYDGRPIFVDDVIKWLSPK